MYARWMVGRLVGWWFGLYYLPKNGWKLQFYASIGAPVLSWELVLEGKKHWRLYEPDDKLPRYSSKNLSQVILYYLVLCAKCNYLKGS